MNSKNNSKDQTANMSAKTYRNQFMICATVLSALVVSNGVSVNAEEANGATAPENATVSNVVANSEANEQVTPAANVEQAQPNQQDDTTVSTKATPNNDEVLPAAEVVKQDEAQAEVMSDEEKQRAMAQMGANQGDVWVWSSENDVPGEKRGPNGGPGQFNGGAVVMGGRASYSPPADWYYLAYKANEGMTDDEAKAIFNKELGKWMDEFDPWGVVLEMSDNKATNAWADARNMKAFVLREGATTWDKIVDHPEAVQWVSQFKGNMGSGVGEANHAEVPSGGTSMEVLTKQDRVAHWGSNQARNIQNPQSIRAVLVSVEARISEKSDPDAKLGIQVGGDWKFGNEEIHPFWYPGAGLSGIQRLSKDWQRYYFVSITGVQDAVDQRAITPEVFLGTTVPLADLNRKQTPPTTDDQNNQPNNQQDNQQNNHQNNQQDNQQNNNAQQDNNVEPPKVEDNQQQPGANDDISGKVTPDKPSTPPDMGGPKDGPNLAGQGAGVQSFASRPSSKGIEVATAATLPVTGEAQHGPLLALFSTMLLAVGSWFASKKKKVK